MTYPPIRLAYWLLALGFLAALALPAVDVLSALLGHLTTPIVGRYGLLMLLGLAFFRLKPMAWEGAYRLQEYARNPYLTLRNRIALYGVLPVWAAVGLFFLGLHGYAAARLAVHFIEQHA